MNAGYTHNQKTDKAWERLHNRLDKEGLLPDNNNDSKKRAFPAYIMAAATLVIAAGLLLLYPFKANDPEVVMYTNNEKESISVTTLTDGSTVYMASKSTLSFPVNFSKSKREIFLSGDAFFEVTGNQKSPFTVTTSSFTITVLGTSFMVGRDNSGNAGIAVQSGEVLVTITGTKQEKTISAGNAVSVANNKLTTLNPQQISNFMTKGQKLHFKDQKLKDVIRVINSKNGNSNNIITISGNLTDRVLTGTFSSESHIDAVKMICVALDLNYTEKEGTINIHE